MTPEQTTTIVVGTLQSGGLLFVAWCWIRGLKAQLKGLQGTIEAQEKTLGVMEKRITETEKVGDIYRNLLNNLPEDLDKYKSVISRMKDDVIISQQQAIKDKDDKLKELAEVKLRALEIQEKILAELPDRVAQFQALAEELQSRLASMNVVGFNPLFYPGVVVTSLGVVNPSNVGVVFNPRNSLLLNYDQLLDENRQQQMKVPDIEPKNEMSDVPKVSPIES